MKQIPFEETIELLVRYQIPVVPSAVFNNKKEAQRFFAQIKKPAAMKVDAADIWHRTEAQGVFLNVERLTDFNQAWRQLTQIEGMRGVIIQEMRSGLELVLGVKRDIQFGPVVMFGLGGILVEIMQDVSLRVVPIDLVEAKKMISEIKGYRLLTGFRGQLAVDENKLAEMIVNLGCLAAENPKIAEVDLNPVMAVGHQIDVVDAKIWISEP